MTNPDTTSPGTQALRRARQANRSFWSSTADNAQFRRTRDLAVAEALEAGISSAQVADELGVLIKDVERMACAVRPTSR
jgi:hypothetical protein